MAGECWGRREESVGEKGSVGGGGRRVLGEEGSVGEEKGSAGGGEGEWGGKGKGHWRRKSGGV